ncbi:hypothetical protein BB559_002341 [Furculomyces boomerangus]|uniref:Transmembrane protein 19 n=2 Tax=Harpellales TaxID=61421 RepID=A0A2T9YW61_9FUNG|nr:hypothetical protein BB559_002341 [Furculomyces boomerangus]PVZ99409.1 hypothetical protein BB558_004573 [Smittium angustum]
MEEDSLNDINQGSSRFRLKKLGEDALGDDVLRKAVELPPGEDPNEWISCHIVDFYNHTNMLFSSVTHLCTKESCPIMSAGPKYEYLWNDRIQYKTPTRMAACEYISNLMNWVNHQIENEALFPIDPEFFYNHYNGKMRMILALGLTFGVIVVSLFKNALSWDGLIATGLVGLATFSNDNLMFLAGVLTFFISGTQLTKYGSSKKKLLDADYKKDGKRNSIQVFCNGFVGSVISVIYTCYFDGKTFPEMSKNERSGMYILLYSYLAFYACCAGDTWASELGPLSNDWPVLIGTRTEVPPGTNGGITKLGLMASALGGAAVGLSMDVMYWIQYYSLLKTHQLPRIPFHFLGSIFGLLGSLIDSYLGSKYQASYLTKDKKISNHKSDPDTKLINGRDILSNNMVNFISLSMTAILGGFLAYAIYCLH